MKRSFGVFLAAAALLLVAAPARAQGGFIHGLGGVTFGTEVGPVFGGGGGIAVGERLQIFGEFGRMGNVFPADLQTMRPRPCWCSGAASMSR